MVKAILALAFALGAAASPLITPAPVAVKAPVEARVPQATPSSEPFFFGLKPLQGTNTAGVNQLGGEGFAGLNGAYGEVGGAYQSSKAGQNLAGHVAGNIGDQAQGTAGGELSPTGAEGCAGGHLGGFGYTQCLPNPSPTSPPGGL